MCVQDDWHLHGKKLWSIVVLRYVLEANMVNIITDSTSDLGEDIAAEFKVTVIPLAVTIAGRIYHDGVDIRQENLFDLVEKYAELPKTAAPSVGEFIKAFDRPGESVFIGISSKLSATIQNARLALEMLPTGKVRVVDSLNLSTGVGLLVLHACELRDRGLSAEQIEQELLNAVNKVRTSFVLETMEYLYKGGRCTALQAIAGSVLKIHPIIEVRPDGILGVKEKARGTLQKGLQMILDDFDNHLDEVDRRRVFITTTSDNEGDIKFLVDGVKRIAAPQDVRVTRAGSVISSHCGPGTTGILYFVK
jgi:DegV family protein with EDD domain